VNLKRVASNISGAVDQLHDQAGEVIFDEWALVEIDGDDWTIHSYKSPRSKDFEKLFFDDIAHLREKVCLEKMEVGASGFVEGGDTTKFDAYMCVGPKMFIFFNNLRENVQQMSRHEKWHAFQEAFHRAVKAFLEDPVISACIRFLTGNRHHLDDE
jgi:hypothetical protein